MPVAFAAKLGGAAITRKNEVESIDDLALDACVTALSLADRRLGAGIVVHGAGSFGHGPAKAHDLVSGHAPASAPSSEALLGACTCAASVAALNSTIVRRLVAAGIPAVSVQPRALVTATRGVVSAADCAQLCDHVQMCVDRGMLPVIHGDVVWDAAQGWAILSGDTLLQHLAAYFRPERVIFVSDVDGVFTADPRIDPTAQRIPVINTAEQTVAVQATGASSADGAPAECILGGLSLICLSSRFFSFLHSTRTAFPWLSDVTGGMATKFATAMTICQLPSPTLPYTPVYICRPGSLAAALRGGKPSEEFLATLFVHASQGEGIQ